MRWDVGWGGRICFNGSLKDRVVCMLNGELGWFEMEKGGEEGQGVTVEW